MRHDLNERAAATRATAELWLGREFEWGRFDCARLVASHIRRLGHRPKIAKAGSYRTALSARAALKRLGADGMAGLADLNHLPRIAPAAALVGDLLSLPGDDAVGAMTVALGNGRVLGWSETQPECAVLQPIAFDAAWRVG